MSKKLAIKGHATRGKEVIELLKMLGAQNPNTINECCTYLAYYIDDGNIETLSSYNDDDFIVFTLEEFLEKYPFKVGEKVNSPCKGCIKTITSMKWDEYLNAVTYKLDNKIYTNIDQLKVNNDLPSKEEVNMKDDKAKDYCTKAPEKCNETKKIAWFKFGDDDFADKVELDLNDRELIQENGKWFVVKKEI